MTIIIKRCDSRIILFTHTAYRNDVKHLLYYFESCEKCLLDAILFQNVDRSLANLNKSVWLQKQFSLLFINKLGVNRKVLLINYLSVRSPTRSSICPSFYHHIIIFFLSQTSTRQKVMENLPIGKK